MLTHLTLSAPKEHPRNRNGKTIVRPECVEINQIFYPHHFPLTSPSTFVNGDGGSTMKPHGIDWEPDTKIHDIYLRLNHYPFRDENYFWTVRVPREQNKEATMKLYETYNTCSEKTIVNFMKEKHPKKFKTFWQQGIKDAKKTCN